MKRNRIWCLSGLLWWSMVAVCYGTAFERPYQAIVKRNAFNLKPPQEERPLGIPLTRPNLRLSGITTFGGKRVFLKMQVPSRAGERVGERSVILREGQREGEIEVLKIDEERGRVEIRFSGQLLIVKFEEGVSQDLGAALPAKLQPRGPLP